MSNQNSSYLKSISSRAASNRKVPEHIRASHGRAYNVACGCMWGFILAAVTFLGFGLSSEHLLVATPVDRRKLW